MILENIEKKICNNFKLYLKRHESSIEVIFLMIYVALNFCLVTYIVNPKVSYFVILLLFFIGVERLILHIKLNLNKDDINKKEKEIKGEFEKFDTLFRRVKEERNRLKTKNKVLKKQKKFLIAEIRRRLKYKR